jgi:hypothetical protein
MKPWTQRLAGACAGASLAALCMAAAYPAAASADPPAKPPTTGMHEDASHEYAQHIQAHLDALAARLEIKASQESAWQAFAGAFRDLVTPPPGAGNEAMPTDLDAASIAREHADRAAQHAQKLARVAEATAKLQQALSPEQRLVLNEAARRFAHGPRHPWMEHEGKHHLDGEHCHGDGGPEHGHWEHGYGPDSMPGMDGPKDGPGH